MYGETTAKVLALREKSPRMPLIEMAREIGVTRQRISQILQRAGLPARFPPGPFYCRRCGKELHQNSIHCQACHLLLQYDQTHIPLVCDQCGKTFYRGRHEVRRARKLGYKHTWCGRRCLGRWLGLHYGKKLGRGRKWDYELIFQLRRQGLTGLQIAEKLGMPSRFTAYRILSRYGVKKGKSGGPA